MTPEQAVVAAILICMAGAVRDPLASRVADRRRAGLRSLTATVTAVLIGSAVAHVLLSRPLGQPAAFLVIP